VKNTHEFSSVSKILLQKYNQEINEPRRFGSDHNECYGSSSSKGDENQRNLRQFNSKEI